MNSIEALSYVAPVSEEQSFVERVLAVIEAGVESLDTSRHNQLTTV